MHADRLSNSSIALRREPQAPINDIPLADSPMRSSAPDSDTIISAQPTRSRRNSVPKCFPDITDRKAGKRKIKRNEKSDSVYGLTIPFMHLDSCMRRGRMDGMSDFEGDEEEMENGRGQPLEQGNAAEQGQGNVEEDGAAIGEEQEGEWVEAIPFGAEQASAPISDPLQPSGSPNAAAQGQGSTPGIGQQSGREQG